MSEFSNSLANTNVSATSATRLSSLAHDTETLSLTALPSSIFSKSGDYFKSDHAVQLMNKLNSMRSNSLYCDYEIRVNGHSFHCHKFILIATSDFFKAMLSGI
jgi:hypothetical protein